MNPSKLPQFFNASDAFKRLNPGLFGGSLKTPPWSAEEDIILRSHYEAMHRGEITQAEIARRIGRSMAACACRANSLGITCQRGKHFRPNPAPYVSKAKFATDEERRLARSERMKKQHAERGHPMKGRPVPEHVRVRISNANSGRIVPPDKVLAGLKTRAKNGTLAPNKPHGSWKASWQEVGGKRFYARSSWEANYARYLQMLKEAGQIEDWEHEPETFWFLEIKRGSRSYLPDFRVKSSAGIAYHEVKGWMDSRSKTKLKRMAKYHPTVKIELIDPKRYRALARTARSVVKGWI